LYDKSEEYFKLQMQLTYSSFLGASKDYHEFLKKWENNYKLDSTVCQIIDSISVQGFNKTRELILKEAQNQKLVMFNENHFYPNHRLLLSRLLQDFKKLGFNYLALETLVQDSALNSGSAITLNNGFYTREQNYSELIRKAQALGFKFVAYENYDEEKERKLGEAENLYNQTFKKDSLAKVVVLAGISHIFKSPDNQKKKWMASILKEKYGIDPLTFDQTSLNPYNKTVNDIAIIKSADLKSKYYNTTDWQIINNLPLIESSGNFEYKNEFKTAVQLALFLESDLNNQKLINDKVPFRSFLLQKGETFYTRIPSQDYRFIIFDKNGAMLKNEIINVRMVQ